MPWRFLISSLEKTGKIADKQKMEDATYTVISSLKDVAKTAIDNKHEDDTRKVMTSIREIGLSNITSGHTSHFVLDFVVISLENIITKVAEKLRTEREKEKEWKKKWEKEIWHGIFALQSIGFKLIKNKNIEDTDKQSFELVIMGAIFSISEITIDLEREKSPFGRFNSNYIIL